MGAAIFNIVMGLIAIGAGLTGRPFIGTDSPYIMIAIGAAIFGLGVYQLIKSRRGG